ncbi:DUF3199 family protein [Lysinibacillus fusiformis]|jgi:hypothetical protein|uniref:DUF3199 family protein n=1 Tax=Lysinibacillus fusiformis TaxID=28031 RepID=UPI003CFD7ED1
MAFATIQEVRNQTTLSEISDLSDEEIERYIAYANSFLRRYTGRNYRDETDPDLLTDLKRVTVLLVEYIWFNDTPEAKEANYSGIESERIGSYSYNLGSATTINNPELDQLLNSLRPSIGLNLFSVNGPSKRRGGLGKNPHAYVTDREGE